MGRQSRLKAERRAEREREARAAAQRRERRRVAGAEEGRRRGCLICRRSDGGFTTEEHIIPETLGNTEKVGEAFDRERAIIMKGGHHDWLATFRNVNWLEGELHHGMWYAAQHRNIDGHPLLFLVAWLWGLPLATDTLRPEPPGEPPPESLLVWTF